MTAAEMCLSELQFVRQEVDMGVSWWWVSWHTCTLAFVERRSELF